MKYIRTKDGIYEVIKNDFGVCIKIDGGFILLEDIKDKVIKGADTIAELCDKFVVYDKRNNVHYLMDYDEIIKAIYYGTINEKDVIYGAVWTDKGLIYVAKMNENGELVLI